MNILFLMRAIVLHKNTLVIDTTSIKMCQFELYLNIFIRLKFK